MYCIDINYWFWWANYFCHLKITFVFYPDCIQNSPRNINITDQFISLPVMCDPSFWSLCGFSFLTNFIFLSCFLLVFHDIYWYFIVLFCCGSVMSFLWVADFDWIISITIVNWTDNRIWRVIQVFCPGIKWLITEMFHCCMYIIHKTTGNHTIMSSSCKVHALNMLLKRKSIMLLYVICHNWIDTKPYRCIPRKWWIGNKLDLFSNVKRRRKWETRE